MGWRAVLGVAGVVAVAGVAAIVAMALNWRPDDARGALDGVVRAAAEGDDEILALAELLRTPVATACILSEFDDVRAFAAARGLESSTLPAGRVPENHGGLLALTPSGPTYAAIHDLRGGTVCQDGSALALVFARATTAVFVVDLAITDPEPFLAAAY